MGCRTRVIGNVYDPERQTTYGRGNLSFTTINLPLIALDCVNSVDKDNTIEGFYIQLNKYIDICFDQLLSRLKFQGSKKIKNFPTLMGQGIWLDSEKLSYEDTLEEILKHGTLTIGFIGLAECLIALIGKHHGESNEAQKLGLEIIKFMRKKCDDKSQETKLNFSLMGTPAESTAGSMLTKIKNKYGIIPGITDKEYLTNSNHVPVYYPITAFKKIEIEAPYHEFLNAGHILYVELEGNPENNVEAFMDLVKYAASKNVGYFAINHEVAYCPICNYSGYIADTCPRCGRKEGEGVSLSKLKELKKKFPDIRLPR